MATIVRSTGAGRVGDTRPGEGAQRPGNAPWGRRIGPLEAHRPLDKDAEMEAFPEQDRP